METVWPRACSRRASSRVDAAFAVHKELGPGLLESVYEVCLCRELSIRNVPFRSQVSLPVTYKGLRLDAGLRLEPKRDRPSVRMPNLGEDFPRPYMQPERIAENSDYGRIVCFCERVTGGEILDALAAPIPAVDLDGLRRRTRVLMGRCQGFFCGAHVAALLANGGEDGRVAGARR